MKQIPFKVVPIVNPKNGEAGEIDYRELLKAAIHNPLDGKALSIDEIRSSLRLLDAIEKGDKKGCSLEDADFEFLAKKVRAMKFMWADAVFVKFVDDVTN